jgi:hypothetical protein
VRTLSAETQRRVDDLRAITVQNNGELVVAEIDYEDDTALCLVVEDGELVAAILVGEGLVYEESRAKSN